MTKLTHKQIWSALHPTNSFATVVRELEALGVRLADYVAAPVVKDRIVKRGKNAGKRQITYNIDYWLTVADKDALFMALTGLPKNEYVSVSYFFKNEKGQTMFSLVIPDTTQPTEYIAHWMEVWKSTHHLCGVVNMDLINEELDLTNYA